MNLSEFRQKLGHIKKLENLQLYYNNVITNMPLTATQRVVIQEIYERRKFDIEHKEMPKRDKR